MLILGVSLALVAGIGHNATAALEKREAVRVGVGLSIVRLLPALARRRWWLVAQSVGLLAWAVQVVAMSVAPLAVVSPLTAAGGALLVVLGIHWLGERFSAGEIMSIALVAVGAAVAAAADGGTVSRLALSAWSQTGIGILALSVALLAASRRSGIGYGTAAGILYAATAIYSKEVGDRFVVHGWAAARLLALGPTPWALLLLATTATAFMQAGFQRANAASVAAAASATGTLGPVTAGFLLYHEAFPEGVSGVVLAIGIAATVFGASFLAARTRGPWRRQEEKVPEP